MVPFAALLLEYPVAYCPPATVTSPFLSSVVLDVYEVCLELPATEGNEHRTSSSLNRRQPILKFSCPSDLSIASSGMLSPGSLMEELRSRFDARVTGKGLKVSVHHSSEILDRVAL
ncbi:hypothetical protein BDP27DRAFT_487878 [Rhodocollybia butyracea]|uniref:Uncharacterized protein n=1 Tax=Rhodocollybia butyracea TaxID=206335 RepID=A0A9P5QB54_9AGAR|nr:hypothetical protein BDP27DRAFT_487878 [Rhodocollybia butyracea]